MQIPGGDSIIDKHHGRRRRRIRQHGRIVCFCFVQGRGGAEAQLGMPVVCVLASAVAKQQDNWKSRERERVSRKPVDRRIAAEKNKPTRTTAGKERPLLRTPKLASERVF